MPRLTRLILASASPRRLKLLREIGLEPIAEPSNIPEDDRGGETPDEHVLRLAEAKGRAVASRLDIDAPPQLVLAADTGVVLDGRVLGKPRDRDDARRMLRALRGRVHEVKTAVFLLRTDDRRFTAQVETTRVTFRVYDDRTLRAYVDSDEPLDKAGGYGIQGGGAVLVARVDGSWSNVVGLPLERLGPWMKRIGVDLEALIGRNAPG